MEDFSTSRRALVPRLANLATLATVLAATWWSGAQRPVDAAAEAAQQAPASITLQASVGPAPSAPEQLVALPAAMPSASPAALPADEVAAAPAATQALWTSQSGALRRDGLQAVGFGTTTRR